MNKTDKLPDRWFGAFTMNGWCRRYSGLPPVMVTNGLCESCKRAEQHDRCVFRPYEGLAFTADEHGNPSGWSMVGFGPFDSDNTWADLAPCNPTDADVAPFVEYYQRRIEEMLQERKRGRRHRRTA